MAKKSTKATPESDEIDFDSIGFNTDIPKSSEAPVSASMSASEDTGDEIDFDAIGYTSDIPEAPEADPNPMATFLKKYLRETGEDFGKARAEGGLSASDIFAQTSGLAKQEQDAFGGGPRTLYDPSRAGPLESLGSGAEGALQHTGNVLGSGMGLAASVIPRGVREAAKEFIAPVVAPIATAYDKATGSLDPQTKATLGSTLELGSTVVPLPKVLPSTAQVAKVAAKIKGKAVSQEVAKKAKDLEKLIEPVRMSDKGPEDIIETKYLKSQEWVPPKGDRDILEALASVPEVRASRSATYNVPKVTKALETERLKLESKIKALGNPKVDQGALKADFDDFLDNIDSFPETMTLSGNALDQATKMIRYAETLFKGSDGSALGLLQARRDFDQWLIKQNKNIMDADKISATGAAKEAVRNILNNRVSQTVPRARLADSLSKQSNLYRARDRLVERRNVEGGNMFNRSIAILKDHGIHLPVTPLALAATGGAAASVLGGPLALAGVAGGAAAGVGTLALAKFLASPTAKKTLASMIAGLNKVIRKASGSKLVELKAHRMALIDLMQQAGKPQEEEYE